jgi:hypothetical protein
MPIDTDPHLQEAASPRQRRKRSDPGILAGACGSLITAMLANNRKSKLLQQTQDQAKALGAQNAALETLNGKHLRSTRSRATRRWRVLTAMQKASIFA